jgi:hypothetical protein
MKMAEEEVSKDLFSLPADAVTEGSGSRDNATCLDRPTHVCKIHSAVDSLAEGDVLEHR